MKKYLFLAATAVVALSSCSNEEVSEVSVLPGTGETPIEFTAYTGRATRYSASEADIYSLVYQEEPEEVGGFSLTGTYLEDEKNMFIMDNALYTVDVETDQRACSPVSGQIPLWTDDIPTDTQISFYAYYPSGTAQTTSPVTLDAEVGTLTISNVDGETDVMAAAATVTKGEAVALGFKHLLAQVEMNVRYDEDYADLFGTGAVAYVDVSNLTLQAPASSVYDLAEGVATVPAPDDGGDNISRYPFATDNGFEISENLTTCGTAMIPAANSGSECTLNVGFTFTLQNQQQFYFSKNATVTIVAGSRNVINVTVKGDAPISITASVEAWENAANQTVEF